MHSISLIQKDMKVKLTYLLGMLLLLWCFSAKVSIANEVEFRSYSVNNGLSSNTVWNIVQDRQGYMWFGTKNGLNRFDGYQFRTYQINTLGGKNKSYGNSFIHAVCEIDEHTFWVGTEEGVFSFDLRTEQFFKIYAIKEDLIFAILKDHKGGIWIGSRANGLYYFSSKTEKPINYRKNKESKNSISLNQIRRLEEDREGNIWIGTFGAGVDIYNPRTKKFSNISEGTSNKHLSSSYIISMYKDKSGNLWIGTLSKGLNKWEATTKTFSVYASSGVNTISDNIVRAIHQHDDTTMYIGTEKGLNVLNLKSGKFHLYTHKADDPYSISDNAIYSIYSDNYGGVWVGTFFGGVNYFFSKSSALEEFYDNGKGNTLYGNAVSCFLEDKPGYMWIGTENGGLNYFDAHRQTFKQYPFERNQDPLSYNNIHALYKDKKGNIWIGTFSGGLNVYNPNTGKVKKYMYDPLDDSSLSYNSVYTINEDLQGNIWIGTVKGLNIYDPHTDSFIRVNDMDLQNSCIYKVHEDQYGNIWVATYEQGLLGLNRYTNKWVRYGQSTEEKSITSNKVIALMDDGLGNLWLGTDGGALNCFNIHKKTFTYFGKEYGISSVVFGILQDAKGFLWLSTNNGIVKFDPKTSKSWAITNRSHFQSRLYNYNAYLKTTDGKMYFGSIKGFNTFYPEEISFEATASKIVFTNFKLFNKDVNYQDDNAPIKRLIHDSDTIQLEYNQSVISFEYAALNYNNPNSIKYAYIMEGFDQDWNYVENQRIATYTNLPPGNYVFKVKSTDSFGNWNDQIIQIKLIVSPPWYKSNLAYFLYFLLGVGIFVLLRNSLHKRQNRLNEARLERLHILQEKELYNHKIEFFTTMAHEIRTPLSLILAPLEVLKNKYHTPEIDQQLEVLEENTDRLKTLVDQLLDFRRIESDIYTIRKEKLELITFVHAIYSHFSAMAAQKGIRFVLTTDINQLLIQADPEALQKILSNLLINAFKYTKTSVKIMVHMPQTLSPSLQSVSVSVTDDGVGIPADQIEQVFKPFYRVNDKDYKNQNIGGSGIGLSLAKALVEKHKGELIAESIKGIHTTFKMTIPFEIEEQAMPIQYNGDESEDNANNPFILLVEDDHQMRSYIHTNLKNEGFHIISVANGKEALKITESNSIELIISDVMMPEMDGIELCSNIKFNIQTSHIPFILLTAKGNSETEIHGIENGADTYILKPFKWKHLLASIKNLLDSRQKLKEKFGQQPFVEVGVLTTNNQDKLFVQRIQSIIEERIDDYQFSVEELSKEVGMSRSSLHKKLKAISGHVPNEFIRLIRLKNAAKMLLDSDYTIAEIGYKNGFNSPSYFTRCFLQHFKITPTEFIEKYNSTSTNEKFTIE